MEPLAAVIRITPRSDVGNRSPGLTTACSARRRDATFKPMEGAYPSQPKQISVTGEDRFRKLLESAPDAMVIANRDGRIVLANTQTERIFGYAPEELVGQPVELLVPEKFRGIHAHHRGDFHAQPHVRPMGTGLELSGLRKDGTTFPVEISLSPLDDGDEFLVTAAIRDVSERKKAEDALRESEERFRLLVEEVKDYGIFMLDMRGRIQSWNAGAEKIKGYRADEILGEHFSRFYTPEDVARGKPEEGLRLAATDGRWEEEGWRVRKDGTHFWANVVITALRDQHGVLTGFTKVTRDITQRRREKEAFLLEITNALVSNLDIRGLLGAIASCLRQVQQFDFATLALYDSETRMLKTQALVADTAQETPEN